MTRVKYKIHSNNWRKQRLLRIGILSGVGLATATFLALELFKSPARYHAPSLNLPNKKVATQPPPKAANYGLPVRLKIPKVGIDAPITYQGLTKAGDMAVPTNITDVGWYKNGSLPGNKGSAVLAGHVYGLKGEPGVFAHLDKLQIGDTLQIIDSNRAAISFTVKETRTYGKDAQLSEVFNATDTAHLNLITCTGAWDKAQRHYLERLVVFTYKSS